MAFDPALPVNNSSVTATELRGQFNGLFDLIQAVPAGPPGTSVSDAVVDAVTTANPGEPATASASLSGTTVHFSFTIPRGEGGAQGEQGTAGLVGPPFTNFAATVTPASPADIPSVSTTFDGTTVRLDFILPQAAPGTPGEVTTAQLNSAITDAVASTAQNPSGVASFSGSISDPPTQAEMGALAAKVEELLNALKRS